ncbi:RNA polymerase subunit sigma-70 [Enterocloster lavalensis]|uniref:RNA polymerase subunit sigma-70 n=1 Tax=Enterocloster lavalensis TaxID=460384 RepID=UPI0026655A02|nr:RNA polymerase subunit sigma-70 [Enterocloster lavalensis]
MDKQILEQYIDACELIKETEEDIRRVKKQRKTIVQDRVHGSMKEFPYAAQSFKVQGVAYSVVRDPGALEAYERLLEERKTRAEEIKVQVEAWLNTIPQRLQRIIRFKFFEGFTWAETATKIGRRATGESVKKEYQRFIGENEKLS